MADAKPKVKITVLKKIFNEELAEKYGQEAVVPCTAFTEGQEFITDAMTQPKGFCGFAFKDMPADFEQHA